MNKKVIASIVAGIILVAGAMVAVFFIWKNPGGEKSEIIADTQATEKVAEVIFVEETTEEETTNDRHGSDTGNIDRDVSNGNTRNDNNGADISTPEPTPEPETEPAKSVEELAKEVVDGVYGNGEDRVKALGERYEEVQRYVDANYIPPAPSPVYYEDSYSQDYSYDDYSYSYPSGSGVLTPDSGINYYNGTLETYYNLDMSGVVDWMHSLGYGGEYWVREDGVKMLGDYIMVAADYGQYPKGTVVDTSLGTGLVCDTGMGGYDWFDIAVEW